MKNFFTIFLLVIIPCIFSPVFGEWPMHVIDPSINNPAIVEVGDIDGDGDLDAVATAFSGDKVFWYENEGGSPITWTKRTIDVNLDGAVGVFISDIDGDDTLDVVAAGNNANDVKWYKNEGGSPIIWTPNIIDGNLGGAEVVETEDIDGDGDQDVIVTGYSDNDVVWYENDLPNTTWNKHTIDGNLLGAMCLDFGDINYDGNLDVIATGATADDVVWYANGGIGLSWTKHIIDANLNQAWGVRVEDIDGDDTLDVVAAGKTADEVRWYKNSNAGQNWTQNVIVNNLDGAMCVCIGDINLDSIPDVVVTGNYADKVICFENNLPAAWTKDTLDANLDGANYVCLVDLKYDGDLDVFVTGWNANQVVWYENLISGIEQASGVLPFDHTLSQNYPNPFNPSTTIEFSLPKTEFITLKIYNMLGQEVTTLVSEKLTQGVYKYTWDAGSLASGVYLYHLQVAGHAKTQKMTLLR